MGHRVGILNTWFVFICLFVCKLILNFPRQCTTSYTIGASCALYSQVLSLHDGYVQLRIAIDSGKACYLP